MRDSRTGLEGKTKRELVELLLTEFTAWPGDAPLAEERRAWARSVLALLGECRLWLGETHWRSLCELWVARSHGPDPWLRRFLLEVLNQWLCFLDDVGFEANSLPFPQQPSRSPLSVTPKREPWHLPFGFVKPVSQ